ncbi:hypothetical protein [Streptomyces cyslabdanicus]|uniref:hypothetical protein n=1 Tax=Streptomyces cyslabdanicus TaxID=1470456 RepID=UPI004044D0F7
MTISVTTSVAISEPRYLARRDGRADLRLCLGKPARGEEFGGELGAWRGRQLGVSRAGDVGAVGSGAQRAAVGHRPILAVRQEHAKARCRRRPSHPAATLPR